MHDRPGERLIVGLRIPILEDMSESSRGEAVQLPPSPSWYGMKACAFAQSCKQGIETEPCAYGQRIARSLIVNGDMKWLQSDQ